MTKKEKNEVEKQENNNLTRRDFIAGAGGVTVGTLISGLGLNFLTPSEAEAQSGANNEIPWKYTELNPEVVRKKGYEGYYDDPGSCAYGAVVAILSELEEKIGEPYGSVPPEMFAYGRTGAYTGSLCGALNGAYAVINLTAGDRETHEEIIRELADWYEDYPFPSDNHTEYAKYPDLPQSVSGSVNCDQSVGNFLAESGYAYGDPERSDRCAQLTGDVVAKTVELLNEKLA